MIDRGIKKDEGVQVSYRSLGGGPWHRYRGKHWDFTGRIKYLSSPNFDEVDIQFEITVYFIRKKWLFIEEEVTRTEWKYSWEFEITDIPTETIVDCTTPVGE